MKLEISKYGLNLGEEFEYVATFLKVKIVMLMMLKNIEL